MQKVTIRKHIKSLIKGHGSLRAVSRAIDVDVGYLSRLYTGDKKHPSADTLKKMGLKKLDEPIYEKIAPILVR